MKEGGYKNEPIVFNIGTLGFMSRMGIIIAQELQEAGMNIKTQTMDLPTLLAAGNGDTGWNMSTVRLRLAAVPRRLRLPAHPRGRLQRSRA